MNKLFSFSEVATTMADLVVFEHARQKRALAVGIDGPDCSGKSTLCRSLMTLLKDRFRTIAIHFDDYLNSEDYRLRRGEFSIESFLDDYFDAHALVRSALEPFRSSVKLGIGFCDVLIVEGLFLFRAELVNFFDLRVRLEINESLILERALQRDVGRLGSDVWVKQHYLDQCIPAQKRYSKTQMVGGFAHVVINVISEDLYEIRRQDSEGVRVGHFD